MPYIKRENGIIVSLTSHPAVGEPEEFLADNHPDIVAFSNPPPPAPADTPLTAEDTERWMLSQGATTAVIAALKRDRGKPMP